jgi:DNA topoisomerase VI subunit A
MPARDKRHQDVIKKIKSIMKTISDDVILNKIMPSFEVPKIGYDNTIWSVDKRMLTIGNKTVLIWPTQCEKDSHILAISSNGKRD